MLVKSAKGIRRGFDRDWGKEPAFLGRTGKACLGGLKAEEQASCQCPARRTERGQSLGPAETGVLREHWHRGLETGVAHLCLKTTRRLARLWTLKSTASAPASGPGEESTTTLSLFTTCPGALGRHRLFLKTSCYRAGCKAVQLSGISFLGNLFIEV